MSAPAAVSAGTVRSGELLLLSVCFGLLAASGELVVLAVRKFGFAEVLRMGPHVVWMAPLNDAALFLLLGLGLVALTRSAGREPPAAGLVSRAWRGVGPWRIAVFTLAFAAGYAIMLAMPRLYPSAQLIVALGVGARTAQVAGAQPFRMRLVRRLTAVLAGFFLVAGASVGTMQVLRERRALSGLPAAPEGARNVLLIIWDTVRSSSLSAYGYGRPTTPNLEALAGRGVRFDWAFPTAPWTLPSHAAIFTGRYPHELSASFTVPLDRAFPTLAEHLDAAGFATAGFVANGFYCSLENGLGRGFQHYDDYPITPQEILLASTFGRAIAASARVRRLTGHYDIVSRRSADDVSAAFVRWLDHRPDRPFFAFLNYYDAHEPYLPPEPWRSKFGPQGSRVLWRLDHSKLREGAIRRRDLLGREELTAEFDAYEGAIAYLDDRLGRLLDELERRGLLRNTVVIVTSDHGEHHGEHPGVYGHDQTLFTQETHVPLVIAAPGLAPARVSQAVSLRELGPTILELAGAPPSGMPGASLSRFWKGGVVAANPVVSEYRRVTSVVVDHDHLIRTAYGRLELFDLTTDPEEQKDLAESAEGHARAWTIWRNNLDALEPSHWVRRERQEPEQAKR